jgi:hypothetical protein
LLPEFGETVHEAGRICTRSSSRTSELLQKYIGCNPAAVKLISNKFSVDYRTVIDLRVIDPVNHSYDQLHHVVRMQCLRLFMFIVLHGLLSDHAFYWVSIFQRPSFILHPPDGDTSCDSPVRKFVIDRRMQIYLIRLLRSYCRREFDHIPVKTSPVWITRVDDSDLPSPPLSGNSMHANLALLTSLIGFFRGVERDTYIAVAMATCRIRCDSLGLLEGGFYTS